MPMIAIRPLAAAKSGGGSGVSIGLGETKAGQHIRISLTAAAVKRLAGRDLDPKKDFLKLSINDDAGKTHLLAVEVTNAGDPQAIPLSAGTRGGVFCKVQCWRQVPNGKLPARQMPEVGANSGAALFKMPEWARPDPRKAHSSPIMER